MPIPSKNSKPSLYQPTSALAPPLGSSNRPRKPPYESGQVDVFTIARAEIERELGVSTHALAKAAAPPTVILVAGVNGTGKTTSTAKLAHYLKGQGHEEVLLRRLR